MTQFDTNEDRDLAISDLQREQQGVSAFMEQVPLEVSAPASGEPDVWTIVDGNTLPPANITGISFESVAVTLSTQDPDVGGTRPDGMGRIKNLTTNEFAMCIHDVDAPYGAQAAFLVGENGFIIDSKTFVDGGDTTIFYYLGRF